MPNERSKAYRLLSCQLMKDDVFGQVKIVPIGQIGTFEWTDPAEVVEQTVVKHPFLAVGSESDSFLLLGETAEFENLRRLGAKYLPLQICPAPQIRLGFRKLLLLGYGLDDLIRLAAQHPEQIAIATIDTTCPEGWIAALIEFPDRTQKAVQMRHSTRLGCPSPMQCLFRSIVAKGRYLPEVDLAGSNDTPLKVAVPSARLTLPRFSLDDLRSASVSERYFPPGIVRSSAPRRVLNIDFPLSVLTSDRSGSEIESFLRDLIVYREQSCKTSFFEGQLYLLNR